MWLLPHLRGVPRAGADGPDGRRPPPAGHTARCARRPSCPVSAAPARPASPRAGPEAAAPAAQLPPPRLQPPLRSPAAARGPLPAPPRARNPLPASVLLAPPAPGCRGLQTGPRPPWQGRARPRAAGWRQRRRAGRTYQMGGRVQPRTTSDRTGSKAQQRISAGFGFPSFNARPAGAPRPSAREAIALAAPLVQILAL